MDPAHLKWEHRFELFKTMFRKNPPDVVCLQEVNHYDQIRGFMGEIGYASLEEPFNKVAVDGKEPRDCMATFWKREIFKGIKSGTHRLSMSWDPVKYPQVVGFVHLTHRRTGKELVVVCTHLKAKPEFEQVRVDQASFIMGLLYQECHLPVVICGDMNALPNSDVIKKIRSGGAFDFGGVLLRGHSSAYDLADPTLYTTAKNRNGKLETRCSDYIFYNSGLLCDSNERLPPLEGVPESGLPTARFPSDHLFLVSTFQFWEPSTPPDKLAAVTKTLASLGYQLI